MHCHTVNILNQFLVIMIYYVMCLYVECIRRSRWFQKGRFSKSSWMCLWNPQLAPKVFLDPVCSERFCAEPWVKSMMTSSKHFPCYWPFVRRIHRSPMNSPHKGQWPGRSFDVFFNFICAWINGRISNRNIGDLRRHRAHYMTSL